MGGWVGGSVGGPVGGPVGCVVVGGPVVLVPDPGAVWRNSM